MARLSPERQVQVQKAYAKARDDGMSDGEASTHVMGILTDLEKTKPADVHVLDKLKRPSRPPVR
jgi:hypothetical protein